MEVSCVGLSVIYDVGGLPPETVGELLRRLKFVRYYATVDLLNTKVIHVIELRGTMVKLIQKDDLVREIIVYYISEEWKTKMKSKIEDVIEKLLSDLGVRYTKEEEGIEVTK